MSLSMLSLSAFTVALNSGVPTANRIRQPGALSVISSIFIIRPEIDLNRGPRCH